MKKVKIAIADDHSVSIEGVKALMNFLDNIEVVIEAFNGKDLLEKLETIIPDIILMDVRMPGLDGIDATRDITRLYPQIKVIGMSYYSNEIPFIQHMINAGAKGFVSKNIRVVDIENMVKNLLNEEPYFSSDILKLLLKTKQIKYLKNNDLTQRENEIMQLIYEENSNQEIADKLNIEYRTVETHKNTIKNKLGIKTTVGLIKYIVWNMLKN